MRDRITAIVPTRNEVLNIPWLLRSIPRDMPLIVVDSSEDGTPELVTSLRPDHTLILRRPVAVTEARQLGAEAAQTEWFLFTDADVAFAPDYFEYLPRYLQYDLVYGPKLSDGEFSGYYRWFSWGQGMSHRLGIPAASGSNLLIRREAFFGSGGFDLALTCNEDSEIAWRVKRCGYLVVFAPELRVFARDHRRLHRGVTRKTMHSIIRCLLLYFNLLPARWRSHDWGYWKNIQHRNSASPHSTLKG